MSQHSTQPNTNAMPWVEKYRPSCFDDIVLDPINKMILSNILKTNYFPNLLFYGPPGTGKTTTIINLVNSYQEKLNMKNKGLMIHLNASDERGIDIIRNQINSFVSTKSMFGTGIKFVILDEVDYMTKNAQIALRYLLTSYTDNNVRFCLICNYVSRIDESLQTEFVRMRFNQLPEHDILTFLQKISETENLGLANKSIISIQKQFSSDIRSMINYMQTNQDIIQNTNIITNSVWETLTDMFVANASSSSPNHKKFGITGGGGGSGSGGDIISFLQTIGRTYNIEIRTIIKSYFYYIIRFKPAIVNCSFLGKVEHIIHLPDIRHEYLIHYFVLKMTELFTEKMMPVTFESTNAVTRTIKIRRKIEK
jgi:replication-associated recombination protein RarA